MSRDVPGTRPPAAASVHQLLRLRAEEAPDVELFTFLEDGDVRGRRTTVTRQQLWDRAQAVATHLRGQVGVGDRVVLLYPPGIDFIAAFQGCLIAGVVAVPAWPPEPARLARSLERLGAIAEVSGASAVLTQGMIAATAPTVPDLPEALRRVRWLSTDNLPAGDPGLTGDEFGPDDIAFLQFTSGSTSRPKGVIVTHGNVLANNEMVRLAFGIRPGDALCGWLPLFHDMGLIGNVLSTIHAGVRAILMSPAHFLKRPLSWMEAVSVERATIAGGPDFGWSLCARRATPEAIASLDLSCLRLAYNGAEPVNPDTLARFSDAFASVGFAASAFYPTYGLAEGTLLVTGKEDAAPPRIARFDIGGLDRREVVVSSDGRAVAACGRPPMGEVLIVDPETREKVTLGRVGEVWLRGAHVCHGYWQAPEATGQTFEQQTADGDAGWMRTGDLGFIDEGDLFVTGRIKELIIHRGRNLVPQDLERLAEAADPRVRPGGVAAFGVPTPDGEGVALMVEVADGADHGAVMDAVRRVLAERAEVVPVDVATVPARSVPKTSSGKTQRVAARAWWLAERGGAAPAAAPTPEPPSAPSRVLSLLREAIARQVGRAVADVAADAHPATLGVDSVAAAQLASELENALGIDVPVELFYGHSVAQIADLLGAEDLRARLGAGWTPEDAALPDDLRVGGLFVPSGGPLLVTGGTGFLGAHLLAELLAHTDTEIVALVRAPDAAAGAERLVAAIRRTGRWEEPWRARIRALPGDITAPDLGLPAGVRRSLAASLDGIIHSAAVVHWAAPYAALRAANVDAIRPLLDLAAPRNVPIHHVSSLGVYPMHGDLPMPLDERRAPDAHEQLTLGYFQTKWAAERLLEAARERGFCVSILRPGAITGDSRTGEELDSEGQLFFGFLAGCLAFGQVPRVDKVIDVAPVDFVASAVRACVTRPASWGRSYNLVNPRPMRQLDLYECLRQHGYALREQPYGVWRDAVVALPTTQPAQPLARFAGYYQGMTEARMRRFEAHASRALPVGSAAFSETLLPHAPCPAFDAHLLGVYLRRYQETGLLPAPSAADVVGAPVIQRSRVELLTDYASGSRAVSELYDRAKQRQWDAATRIDWSLDLDPENPEGLPDEALPLWGSDLLRRMTTSERASFRQRFQAWQYSQFLHGEQGALICAARLVEQSPTMAARSYAATQVMDEARHLEVFRRLLDRIGPTYGITPPLRALLDQILADPRWDMVALGMQVLVEGLALGAFSTARDQTRHELIRQVNAYVIEDEARHFAFGRLSLKDHLPALSDAERLEREQFVVEASYLLRDRFLGVDLWESLELPADRCMAHVESTGFLRRYRAELFSRIVPVVRAVGLWGPTVRRAYGQMGILGFGQIDPDRLAAEDVAIAAAIERSSMAQAGVAK